MALTTTSGDTPNWVTLAKVDGPCQTLLLPGQIADGATVACPDGDHTHRVSEPLHMPVVHTIEIGNTIHIIDHR